MTAQFPTIEKFLERAEKGTSKTQWLNFSDYTPLAHEIAKIAQERAELINQLEAAGMRATE